MPIQHKEILRVAPSCEINYKGTINDRSHASYSSFCVVNAHPEETQARTTTGMQGIIEVHTTIGRFSCGASVPSK